MGKISSAPHPGWEEFQKDHKPVGLRSEATEWLTTQAILDQLNTICPTEHYQAEDLYTYLKQAGYTLFPIAGSDVRVWLFK